MQASPARTNIPSLLQARGHTVRWFCRRIGINPSYYYRMESGERPLSQSYLERAADVLNVPVSLLAIESAILANELNDRPSNAEAVMAS